MLKFKDMNRIAKLEKTGELMDHMLAIPKVNGQDLSMEECAAIDIGMRSGFTIATAVAKGKCDEMDPIEIASRAFETAFGMYIEAVVIPDMEQPTEEPESEAEHAED